MLFEDGRVRLFYYEHRGKRHFPEVCQYMTSDNVYPMVFSGSIEAARALLGPTDPAESHEGQIRNVKLLPTDIMHNIAHCSDGPKNAIREIALTFPECFYELFPGITEEYFAMEYPEIPREYYPQFTAWEAWVWGEHIVFSFFYCLNSFAYQELYLLFHRVGSLRHLCILVWCEYENALQIVQQSLSS